MKTLTLEALPRTLAPALAPALAVSALLAFAGTAMAQQDPSGDPAAGSPAAPQAPMEVDTETLSGFADAFLSVQGIREDLAENLAEATTTEAAQAMQREAQEEMAQAVQESGISVQEYNDIAVGMQTNAELAGRVEAAIEQAR